MVEADGGDPNAPACAFRELVERLPEHICRFTSDGTITFVNGPCAEFHGVAADELIGRTLLDLVPDSDADRTRDLLDRLRTSDPGSPTIVHLTEAVTVGGATEWQEWTYTVVFVESELTEIIGVGRDVTSRVEAEQRSRFHAEHDHLTGLLNRRMVMDALHRLANRARRGGQTIGVVFVDIDDFKQVNDRYGHHIGDDVLVGVAAALRRVLRVDDLVGRIGGDEFVVIINPATPDAIEAVRRRLAVQLAELPLDVTVSVGTALSTETYDPDELLQIADRAMYVDKAGTDVPCDQSSGGATKSINASTAPTRPGSRSA